MEFKCKFKHYDFVPSLMSGGTHGTITTSDEEVMVMETIPDLPSMSMCDFPVDMIKGFSKSAIDPRVAGAIRHKSVQDLNRVMSDLKKIKLVKRRCITKTYKPDNDIFYDLSILSETKEKSEILPTTINIMGVSEEWFLNDQEIRSIQKWVLSILFGFSVTIHHVNNHMEAKLHMRRFTSTKTNDKTNLYRLIKLLSIFGLIHNDIKPENIMEDGGLWFTDLDNFVTEIVSDEFSSDTRYYRFHGNPTVRDRMSIDNCVVKNLTL
jgi:hypothetical protein